MPIYKYPLDGMQFPREGFHEDRFRKMVRRRFGRAVRIVRMGFSEDGKSVEIETNRELNAKEREILDGLAKIHRSEREDDLISDARAPLRVKELPQPGVPGEIVYVADGRKSDEGPGLGTGILAYYSDKWRRVSDDGPVEA